MLALGTQLLTIGCLSNGPVANDNSPEPTETTTAEKTSWGFLIIGNATEKQVTVTVTAKDINDPANPIVTFTDTTQLGPEKNQSDTPTQNKSHKRYEDIPLNRPRHEHKLTISVENGPQVSKKFIPIAISSNYFAIIRQQRIEMKTVEEGAQPTGTASTPTNQSYTEILE